LKKRRLERLRFTRRLCMRMYSPGEAKARERTNKTKRKKLRLL
jgi:hypothetical protein